jgi:SAM-dependent methyltransferase
MLPAIIHPADLRTLYGKIRDTGGTVLARLLAGNEKRVRATWRQTGAGPTQWTAIPLIQERIRTRITGDPRINIPQYVTGRYGTPETKWRALSLGCGTGRKELAWAATGAIESLDAFDISPERIAEAQRLAAQAANTELLRFAVGDARSLQLPPGGYNLIIVEDALHHFSPLHILLKRIEGWLAPGGLFVVNEYVGPNRFQWTGRQLAITNRLLSSLPARFALRSDGQPKVPVHRPGKLTMFMSDPSEAAESARILPAVRTLFEIREEKPYGGTILHLLFKDIAHHFLQPDAEAEEILHRCCTAEDEAFARGEIQSDFSFLVAAKRSP